MILNYCLISNSSTVTFKFEIYCTKFDLKKGVFASNLDIFLTFIFELQQFKTSLKIFLASISTAVEVNFEEREIILSFRSGFQKILRTSGKFGIHFIYFKISAIKMLKREAFYLLHSPVF